MLTSPAHTSTVLTTPIPPARPREEQELLLVSAEWRTLWPSRDHRVEGSVSHSQPGSVGAHSLDRHL